MSAEKIITSLKKKDFKPVYWLEGEEVFFIDQVIEYAEHHLLDPSEASFNLTIFYGRDADWSAVVNACRRYPMFAEKQVVLLKEAQHMKDIDKLEGYIENPLSTTLLFVAYKEKKIDGRSRLARLLKDKSELMSAKKMYDNQLPEWTSNLVKSKGYTISPRALNLLVDHIGNDLSRINNEVEKLLVNLKDRKAIEEDDIEKYVGISKEYNVFELQTALAAKNLSKALSIIQYFEGNPKAGPIQMVLPALYNFFSKVYMVFGANVSDERGLAQAIGVNPFFVKDYIAASKKFELNGVEQVILLLNHYNLRSIGVHDAGYSDGELMKEMAAKICAL
ncbi:MAG TPA: DNA polymerase III subunit delta [Parasegetibacter sp.]